MICQRNRLQASANALINEGFRPLGARSFDIRGRRGRIRLSHGLAEPYGPWSRPVRVPGRVDLEITLSPVSEAQN